jgi:hypothetical protein
MAEPTPPPSRPSSGSPDRQALLQAFQDVVRTEKEKKTGTMQPVAQGSRGFQVFMILVAIACALVLVMRPSWLFPRPAAETPALREASLRVRMFVEIERIERFKSEKGSLPASLAEAGADTTSLSYSPSSDSFTLTGRDHGLSLTYTSGTPAKDFLGDSYQLISQRRH